MANLSEQIFIRPWKEGGDMVERRGEKSMMSGVMFIVIRELVKGRRF